MTVSLLVTKFYIPPTRPEAVPRPHLIARLLMGVERPGSFTLLSAPTGFGKTTLLSAFAARVERPLAWLSLDAGDNDPTRFWTHLIAAIQTIDAGVGAAALDLLQAPQPLPAETVPTLLINDLAASDQAMVLVLDDYHDIHAPTIQTGLRFLLEHAPNNFHLTIAARSDPPWPLARFRARGQLTEIRVRDLRFNLTETTDFLQQTMGLTLSVAQMTALEQRTEGWPAALQLAALSLQGRDDIAPFIDAFSGSNLYIADYLIEESLLRQPEAVQTFLLYTAVLDRLTGSLCEAVTGRPDGQAQLTALHRANLFLVPLDDEGRWFRYHHLFADLLQARLRQTVSADTLHTLHRRAAIWYQDNDFIEPAVDHFLAARDFEAVAALVVRTAREMIFAGRVNLLRRWLDAMPDETFDYYPRLRFYRFWLDLLQEKGGLSDPAIRTQEEALKALPPAPENDQLRGELMAVVCRAMVLWGRTAEGIRLAQEALAYLPGENLASRASANSALAIAYGLEGRAAAAEPAYLACLSQAKAAGDYRLAAHTTMAWGLLRCEYGQLHEAARLFRSIIDLEAEAGLGERFFPAGQGYLGLGRVHLERYELAQAETYLEQGIDRCRQGGLDGRFLGRLFRSRLRQAQGDLAGALAEIDQVGQAVRRIDDFQLAAQQIRVRLALGEVDRAAAWTAPFLTMLHSYDQAHRPPLVFLETIQALVSRVLLAQGQTTAALQLLETLEGTARPDGRQARLIDVHLLRALAHQNQAPGTVNLEALASFERALVLAEPEGYILPFLEEGPALGPLLRAVTNRRGAADRLKDYAVRLLDAFGEREPDTIPHPAPLIEPLTPRELEVLAYIAAGDSNQMIADKLVITVRTVKKHTSNILGKLNVDNRTQAAARARELGLL